MGRRLKKLKKIRLHREGDHTLVFCGLFMLLSDVVLYYFLGRSMPFYVIAVLLLIVFLVILNFFRCPIRLFCEDSEGVVVAPADGRIVVLEEVEENEYFHDRRIMVSIFMSLFNVHANWIPVDGIVKKVVHQSGNYHKAWLPKASIENERSTVVIQTADGTEILVRQVAGAMARRIVTYHKPGEECFIDEHLGFIKFGSRVDLYLPLDAEVKVCLHQDTVGNDTLIARLNLDRSETL